MLDSCHGLRVYWKLSEVSLYANVDTLPARAYCNALSSLLRIWRSMVQTISLSRIQKPYVSCPKPVHQGSTSDASVIPSNPTLNPLEPLASAVLSPWPSYSTALFWSDDANTGSNISLISWAVVLGIPGSWGWGCCAIDGNGTFGGGLR